MGNQINKHEPGHQVSKQELEIMYQCEQGQVAQSTHAHSSNQYLVRELTFGSSEKMLQCRSNLQPFLQQNSPHALLTSLLHVESITLHTMCGSEQRLRLIFEYSTVSINDEVQARKQNARFFDYEDACRIVIGCVRALQQIENQMEQVSNLVTEGIYNRIFINTERILVLQSGLIKVAHPLLVSPYDRHQHRHNCYYSPQKLADFDYEQDQKCAIYELGLTLIHILSLQSCKQFYNGFEIKQEQVDRRIFSIWELYHDMLLCEVLTKMTRNYRRDRIAVTDCCGLVAILDDRLCKYTSAVQDRNPINNYGDTQFLKTSNSVMMEPAQLETSIVRSRLGKQLSSRRCEQKYYESESQRKIRSISRRVDSEIVEEDNEVQAMLDEQTENREEDRYHLGSSLKYSLFSSQKLQYFKESSKKSMKPLPRQLKFVQAPQKLGHQKESYIITPESPFYNIALISQSSGQKSGTQSALLKHDAMNKTSDKKLKMQAKQSYFYGNQLAEGIITNEKQNLPATSNIPKQIGGTNKIFQWKRTQFNKKKRESKPITPESINILRPTQYCEVTVRQNQHQLS